MIQADIILVGESEPFASTVFEQAPGAGDRIWVQERPVTTGRRVEVVRRDWSAMVHRPSPNNVVVLWVRDIAGQGEY